MAWYKENSILSFGKYKGKRVKDIKDKSYIDWLHHSKLNVYFIPSILERLEIENRDKRPSK